MIIDFQHHFTPRELIKDDPGDRLVLNYDALGAPSYTVHFRRPTISTSTSRRWISPASTPPG